MPEEYQQTGIYKRRKGMWNTAVEFARLNQMTEARDDAPDARGFLTAFNPLTGETAWQVEMADPWNGGVVFTAGGLVFQGNATGKVVAYHSDTGEALWEHDVYASIVAPPISYELDGVQYVAILTGSDSFAPEETRATYKYGSIAKAVVFALGGSQEIPVPKARDLAIPEQPALTASAEDLNRGDLLYHDACQFCHGGGARSGGAIPDLRMMSKERHDDFLAIVLGGMLQDSGMASFADILSAEDAERIRQYIISRAVKDRAEALATQAAGP
jgi:mono/diheme cytochrome c family protein